VAQKAGLGGGTDAQQGVLAGLRVVDFSSGIAGPISGMLLADHGAEVLKIEPPGGDPFRSLPGSSAWLRGRRSAVLELNDSGDRAVALRHVRVADVVIASYSPRVAAKLGVDAETLTALNPRLVYCAITG
jgi:crotonobetainyl-CoA:carnitine CoA-transferase CaiB-like acyl-CoA transferase